MDLQSNSIYALLHEVATDFSCLESSYFYASFNPAHVTDHELHKLEGFMVFMIRSGEMEIEFNSVKSVFTTNSWIVLGFGTQIRFLPQTNPDNNVAILFFHASFLQGININYAAINTPVMVDRTSPDVVLTDDESAIVWRYIELLRLNSLADINHQIERNVASSLLSALIYQLVDFHYRRLGNFGNAKGPRASRSAYVHDFIKLVHVYYTKERSVAFYASKLFISSKYLSLLVKEATGKSAARWIDEFVLMEAKNLLRFSGKNVQQVAYSLNFSNQSSFGKYFKHLTGMSPTEYQKS